MAFFLHQQKNLKGHKDLVHKRQNKLFNLIVELNQANIYYLPKQLSSEEILLLLMSSWDIIKTKYPLHWNRSSFEVFCFWFKLRFQFYRSNVLMLFKYYSAIFNLISFFRRCCSTPKKVIIKKFYGENTDDKNKEWQVEIFINRFVYYIDLYYIEGKFSNGFNMDWWIQVDDSMIQRTQRFRELKELES